MSQVRIVHIQVDLICIEFVKLEFKGECVCLLGKIFICTVVSVKYVMLYLWAERIKELTNDEVKLGIRIKYITQLCMYRNEI